MYGQKLQLDNKNNIGDENYKILRAVFEQEQSPNLETRKNLAEKTGLKKSQIDIFFWNQRNRTTEGGEFMPNRNKRFTEDQYARLREFFEVNPLPDLEKKKLLAVEMERSVYTISQWFRKERLRQKTEQNKGSEVQKNCDQKIENSDDEFIKNFYK